MLNFSSEIENDDRFDIDKYKKEMNPNNLVDRQKPSELRLKPVH